MDNEFNIDSSNQNLFTGPSYMQVTVNIDNVEKTLLKFEQKKDGDVYMYCKHAQLYRDPGEAPNNDNTIKQQRYSFHRSLDSEKNINFIKQTFETSTTGIKNTHIVTPVIKNNTGFVHVLSRRTPNLSLDKYNAKKKTNIKRYASVIWIVPVQHFFILCLLARRNNILQTKKPNRMF